MVLQNTPSAESTDNTSFPLGLGASLIVTGVAVSLLCQPSFTRGFNWRTAGAVTLLYVATAALVHAGAVIAVRAAFRDYMHTRLSRLVWALWIPVAWLPLLGVLTARGSAWVLAVFPVLSVAATALLTQERAAPAVEDDPDDRSRLFVLQPEVALWRVLVPSLFTAATIQAGCVASVVGHQWLAGLCFSLSCVLPAWRLLERTRGLGNLRAAAATSAVVFVLTWVALLPTLLTAQFGIGRPGLDGLARKAASPRRPLTRSRSSGYSGIILLPPIPKHEALLLPEPEDFHSTPTTRQKTPTVIPFDGQYWYFKAPDARPAPDARIVQADPLKANIRSTDPLPLLMEAHQQFPLALPLRGASTLRLDLTNADIRLGAIGVEVLLRSRSLPGGKATSLGSLILPSSRSRIMDLNRPPVHEALRFAIPRKLRGHNIDELYVRVLSDPSRALGGAEISFQDFALLP